MKRKTYDVFLSYNSTDFEAVKRIAVYLSDKLKMRVWLDKWTLIPGEPWVSNLKRGLDISRTCAVFIGKEGQGPWQEPEVEEALRKQIENPKFRVIPVLLPGALDKPKLPSFLWRNTWVDLRSDLDDPDRLWDLECGITKKKPGRGKPKSQK